MRTVVIMITNDKLRHNVLQHDTTATLMITHNWLLEAGSSSFLNQGRVPIV